MAGGTETIKRPDELFRWFKLRSLTVEETFTTRYFTFTTCDRNVRSYAWQEIHIIPMGNIPASSERQGNLQRQVEQDLKTASAQDSKKSDHSQSQEKTTGAISLVHILANHRLRLYGILSFQAGWSVSLNVGDASSSANSLDRALRSLALMCHLSAIFAVSLHRFASARAA